jgi:histidine triad (HIT) family protein
MLLMKSAGYGKKRPGYQMVYAVAKIKMLRSFVIWGLAHMSSIIPNQVISETDSLICFHHPRPVYPVHILIVPKAEIRDLMHLEIEQSDLLQDVFTITRQLVENLHLGEKGYRLVLNGGVYQEFPQLHFHLIAGESDQLP